MAESPILDRPRRTIRRQIILSNIIIGGLLLLAGGIVIWQVNRLGTALDALRAAEDRVGAALRVSQDSTQLIATLNAVLPDEDTTNFETNVSEALEPLYKSQARLAILAASAKEDDAAYTLLNRVSDRIGNIISITETMVRQAQAEQWPSVRVRMGVLTRDQQQMTNDVNRLVELVEDIEEASEAEVISVQRATVLYPALVVVMAIVLGGLLTWWTLRNVTRPISDLTKTATAIAEGDLDRMVRVEMSNEVGLLAEAFNTMTERLRTVINTLEDRVAARTQQLETVVDISQRLVTILDLSDLLRQVVTLTKETFNYYHVHIYLLDSLGETLIMAEGYGEAGAELKRQGHSISMSALQSLVAQAAREARVVIVGNVREDPNWLPNPYLPDTHSEMAVPVKFGGQVVGVLDVQSERVNGLTIEDESTLQVLANQVAIAVRNANLFSETQERLYEAQRLQRLYTNQTWEQLIATRPTTDYEVRRSKTLPATELVTPEVEAALQQKQTIHIKPPEINGGQNGSSSDSPASPIHNALATPLKLRNQIIGVLGIQDEDPQRQWTEDEIALIEAVTEQMSLAIENARLFEDTQRTAWRDRIVSESTAKLWSSAEVEEVLRAAVAELGNKLNASEVVIRLGTEDELGQA